MLGSLHGVAHVGPSAVKELPSPTAASWSSTLPAALKPPRPGASAPSTRSLASAWTTTPGPPAHAGERGIGALLRGLTRFGWAPVRGGDDLIALTRGLANITLEPAGQLELSGAPLENIHETCCETTSHLREVKTVAEELGRFPRHGLPAQVAPRRMPWMPKGRYKIMRSTCPSAATSAWT